MLRNEGVFIWKLWNLKSNPWQGRTLCTSVRWPSCPQNLMLIKMITKAWSLVWQLSHVLRYLYPIIECLVWAHLLGFPSSFLLIHALEAENNSGCAWIPFVHARVRWDSSSWVSPAQSKVLQTLGGLSECWFLGHSIADIGGMSKCWFLGQSWLSPRCCRHWESEQVNWASLHFKEHENESTKMLSVLARAAVIYIKIEKILFLYNHFFCKSF